MSFRSLGRVLQNVRRAAIVSGAVQRTDGQLLEAFVVGNDEACFDALVRRYGPMVFGVCKRVLRHSHDAEDAFQATFLVLVRKANTLRKREAVGNWLYGVAYRTAMHAKSRTAQRRKSEAEVTPMAQEESTAESAARNELHAILDRELSRLPDKYRAPIILCELMGKSKKQAAEQLRCPEGTVSSRLARGREMLQKRLAQHGSAFAGGTVLVIATETAAQAVPPSLYGSTLKSAGIVANGKITVAAGLSPSVAALVNGVLKSMLLAKLKPTALILVLAMGLLGAGSTLLAHRAEVAKTTADVVPPAKVKSGEPAQVAKVEKAAAADPQKERLRYGGKDFYAWRDALLDLKPEYRIEALMALGTFGVNGYADEATAAIIETMKKYDAKSKESGDQKVMDAAWSQLGKIGPKAVPALAREQESNGLNERYLVSKAASRIFSAFPKEGLPLVLHALNDENVSVRNTALEALAIFRPNAAQEKLPSELTDQEKRLVVSKLIEVLHEDDDIGQQRAERIIALLGRAVKGTVPTLIKLLGDNTPPRKAKGGFEKGGVTSMPKLIAIKALGSIGPDAADAVPNLSAILQSPDESSYHTFTIVALGQIGPTSKVAVPAIIAAFNNNERVAAISLGEIGPEAKEAVPMLVQWLKSAKSTLLDKDRPKAPNGKFSGAVGPFQTVLQVVIALGKIGPAAKEAVPVLREIEKATLPIRYSTAGLSEIRVATTDALKKIQR